MIYIRSFLFNTAFYLGFAVMALAALPVLILPRVVTTHVIKIWARWNIFLMRWLAGIRLDVRGVENIPQGGLLVAAKHQSAFETFALLPYFKDPAFVLKRELNWLPLFGWYVMKARMIPVNRGARSKALKDMAHAAQRTVDAGRQIIIFPEGTRKAPAAPPDYKYGLTHLYAKLDVPCLPVALNSGVYWPRRTFLRYPGTIVIEFLPPIPAGLPASEFHERSMQVIEEASNALLPESRRPIPPVAPQAV